MILQKILALAFVIIIVKGFTVESPESSTNILQVSLNLLFRILEIYKQSKLTPQPLSLLNLHLLPRSHQSFFKKKPLKIDHSPTWSSTTIYLQPFRTSNFTPSVAESLIHLTNLNKILSGLFSKILKHNNPSEELSICRLDSLSSISYWISGICLKGNTHSSPKLEHPKENGPNKSKSLVTIKAR
jgi:hypothetical protein